MILALIVSIIWSR